MTSKLDMLKLILILEFDDNKTFPYTFKAISFLALSFTETAIAQAFP